MRMMLFGIMPTVNATGSKNHSRARARELREYKVGADRLLLQAGVPVMQGQLFLIRVDRMAREQLWYAVRPRGVVVVARHSKLIENRDARIEPDDLVFTRHDVDSVTPEQCWVVSESMFMEGMDQAGLIRAVHLGARAQRFANHLHPQWPDTHVSWAACLTPYGWSFVRKRTWQLMSMYRLGHPFADSREIFHG